MGVCRQKRKKICDPTDPDDAQQGDHWDHLAFDAENRLVVSVVPGKGTSENVRALVQDFKKRTTGRMMNLITSDEYPVYKTEILEAYGETVTPPPSGKPGRPAPPYKVPPPDLKYAMVHKIRKNGRVIQMTPRVIFGTLMALAISLMSKAINIAFVERHNGTDRNRNGRKVRETYGFSKDWEAKKQQKRLTVQSEDDGTRTRNHRIDSPVL